MPPCWAPNAREGEKADFTWEGHTAAATVKDSLGKEVHLEEPTPGAHLPHKARPRHQNRGQCGVQEETGFGKFCLFAYWVVRLIWAGSYFRDLQSLPSEPFFS